MREQKPAERDAPALAAGQGRHVAVALGQPQRVHRAVERGLEAPGVVALDLVLHLACSASSASKSASGSAKAAEIALKRSSRSRSCAHAVLDVAAHVLGRIELGLLLQEADGRARRSSATPDDGSSSPAMIRSSVDLPAPFGPARRSSRRARTTARCSTSTWRSGP